jgi:hypothetical protein
MGKKETSKKATKKKTTKKSVIKEVADNIIESQEVKMDLIEEDPPIDQELLEEVLSVGSEIIEKKEPEYEPTQEEIEKAIESMNGDPSVIIPSNEIEVRKNETIEEAAFKDTFKNVKIENKKNGRIDRMFGYSWNGTEIDY